MALFLNKKSSLRRKFHNWWNTCDKTSNNQEPFLAMNKTWKKSKRLKGRKKLMQKFLAKNYWSSLSCLNMQKWTIQLTSDLSFLMTVVRVIKLRLIWQPSLSLAPSALVCEALSLPARSTKFCITTTKNIVSRHPLECFRTVIWSQKHCFTRLAT